jgi:hypothetical protein
MGAAGSSARRVADQMPSAPTIRSASAVRSSAGPSSRCPATILAPASSAAARSRVTRSARMIVTLSSESCERRPRATSPSSLARPDHIRWRATGKPAACTAGRQPSASSARSPLTARLTYDPTGPAGSS